MMMWICFYSILLIWATWIGSGTNGRSFTQTDIRFYRDTVRRMFQHAYDGYIAHAYPFDELRPLTCDGIDTWGKYSLSLIDALDTLIVVGNYTEFARVAKLIKHMNFDADVNVSVFETNIRIVGGLLSAHLLSHRAADAGADIQLEEGWPCSGPLLRLAEDVARRLLPAFNTETGMPYGTVNLRHGVPPGETTVTCTAGVASYLIEFGSLSRLTGDARYEKVALRALRSLWKLRSRLALVGNHVDVRTGKWVALDSGIGAGVDSYFEYLVKGSILFQNTRLKTMFDQYKESIDKYLKRDDWYFWAGMERGSITMPIFQSLEAFWPGMLSLVGDIDQAMKSLFNYHQIWQQYGFVPEFYNVVHGHTQSGRESYPLRPELIESLMYLYQATHDPLLLEMGADVVESIEHSAKTSCGYATVKDVNAHVLENRMESFFLAETTKYLYLLFDPANFIHNPNKTGKLIHTTNGHCVIDTGAYIFNTEAHPIDSSIIYCCSAQKERDDKVLQDFEEHLDLVGLLGLSHTEDDYLGDVERPRGYHTRDDDDAGERDEATFKSLPDMQHDIYMPGDYISIDLDDVMPKPKPKEKQEEKVDGGEEMKGVLADASDEEQLSTQQQEQKELEDFVSEDEDGNVVSYDENATHSSMSIKYNDSDNIVVSKEKEQKSSETVKEEKQGDKVNSTKTVKKVSFQGIVPEIRIKERLSLNTTEDRQKMGYSVLSCPAQSFISRLSVLGEMFEVDSDAHN